MSIIVEETRNVVVAETPAEVVVEQRSVAVVVAEALGPQGPPGETGPAGPAGGSYEHVQASADTTWVVAVPAGVPAWPAVSVIRSDGVEVDAEVSYSTDGRVVTVHFLVPVAGRASLT